MGVSGQTGLYTFSSLRFTLADMFLDRLGAHFTFVMTSDLSDVVFTADPFKAIPNALGKTERDRFLAAALEATTIDREGINGYWIRTCFGEQVAKHFEGLPISCSGTTLGDITSMRQYVSAMDKEMRSSAFCSAQGTDQGVHNVVLRQGVLKKLIEWMPLDSGPVLTLDRVAVLRFDANGRPVNINGEPYAVIHQVNRCAEFAKKFVEVSSSDSQNVVESRRYRCHTVMDPPGTWWAGLPQK
jgi:hypothetical protein